MGISLLFNFIKERQSSKILLCFTILLCSKIKATTFYVNDNSTERDVYTTSIGNDYNEGTSKDKPKLTILSAYKEAKEGDIIMVDIGNYGEISSKGELLFENSKKIKFLIAGFSYEIYSKTPLPINEKVSPVIFYIKDDKPIEREAYLRNLQDSVDKK